MRNRGILVEAGLVGATVVGVDAQEKMVRGARRNLDEYLDRGAVVRGDATRLPFVDGSFDGAVFDALYGRQSKIEGESLEGLVGDALRRSDASPRGRFWSAIGRGTTPPRRPGGRSRIGSIGGFTDR